MTTQSIRGGVSKEQKTQTKTEHLPQKNNPPEKYLYAQMSPMNLPYTFSPFTASRLFIAAVELKTPMIFLTVPPHSQHMGSNRSSRSFPQK